MSAKAKKRNPEFENMLRNHASLDDATGIVKFSGLYASLYVNIGWRSTTISMQYSHLVWFLKHGRWPDNGKTIDHINDDPWDNKPDNLQELSHQDNQKKRRGRTIYRSYGTGKYGHGIYVGLDKRDGRYYVTRQLSRGHGSGNLRNVRISLGRFGTLDEAEARVTAYLAKFADNLNSVSRKEVIHWLAANDARIRLTEADIHEMRRMRLIDKATIETIAAKFAISIPSAHKIVTLQSWAETKTPYDEYLIEAREDLTAHSHATKGARHPGKFGTKTPLLGDSNPAAKLSESDIHEIRRLRRGGHSFDALASQFGVSKPVIAKIATLKLWGHVKTPHDDFLATNAKQLAMASSSDLREADVREIRRLRAEGVRVTDIAAQFNITRESIYNIVSRKTWRHVE